MSNLQAGKGELLAAKHETAESNPIPRKLWFPYHNLTHLLLPQLGRLTKMTVCSLVVFSFPTIDFGLSAILQPQHEKSCFSTLMSSIPNIFLAQKNTPWLSVRQSWGSCSTPKCYCYRSYLATLHIRQHSSKQSQKPHISINNKGNQTEDSFSDDTESKFCLTIN